MIAAFGRKRLAGFAFGSAALLCLRRWRFIAAASPTWHWQNI